MRSSVRSSVRHAAPWALAATVLAGTVGSAVLGAADRPRPPSPTAWVAGLIATTRAAGSARVWYTSSVVSTGSARELTSGSGVLDFADGDLRASGTEHSRWREPGPARTGSYTLHLEERRVGGTLYVELDDVAASPGLEATPGQWTSTRLAPTPGSLFPPVLAGPSLPALSPSYSAVAVHAVGTATVSGVPTTEYRLTSRLDCRLRRGVAQSVQTAPTLLWVDRHGRLLEARERSTWRFTSATAGRSTTTINELVHLGDFGSPVRVLRPVLRRRASSSSHLVVGASC